MLMLTLKVMDSPCAIEMAIVLLAACSCSATCVWVLAVVNSGTIHVHTVIDIRLDQNASTVRDKVWIFRDHATIVDCLVGIEACESRFISLGKYYCY